MSSISIIGYPTIANDASPRRFNDRDKFLVISPRGNKSPIEESKSIYAGVRTRGLGIVVLSLTMQLSRVFHVLSRPNFSNMSFYQAPWKYRERFTNVYRSTRAKGILIEESRSILKSYREDLFVSSKKFFEMKRKISLSLVILGNSFVNIWKKKRNNLFVLKQE